MRINKRRIVAEEEIPEMETDVVDDVDTADVEVAPDASDLLFEAEDVAELVAEVTGMPVEVEADGDQVVFSVGDADFTVTAEGDEEVLEASTRFNGKRPVKAATRGTWRSGRAARNVRASSAVRGKHLRSMPKRK